MTDIPALRQPSEMPRVRSSEDLYQRWRALMGPLGFGQPRLWIAFLEPECDDERSTYPDRGHSQAGPILDYVVRCWRCADTSSAATVAADPWLSC